MAVWGSTLAMLVTSGCAIQMGPSAYATTANPDKFDFVLEAAMRASHPREHNPYFGANFAFNDPTAEASFGIRKLTTALGYRWRYNGFALEVGGEFGIGQPYSEAYDGTGAYLGAQAVFAFRIQGDHDESVGWAPIGVMVDIVFMPSVGIWTPPFSDTASVGTATGNYGAMVGLRLWTISDLVTVELTGGGT